MRMLKGLYRQIVPINQCDTITSLANPKTKLKKKNSFGMKCLKLNTKNLSILCDIVPDPIMLIEDSECLT